MNIVKLQQGDPLPYDLLLIAEPSENLVEGYVHRGTCYVLKEEGQVIGEFVLLKADRNHMEIMNIAIKDGYRGKGYGKILTQKCIDLAIEEGVKILEISIRNSSIDQLALYQKMGFRIVGVEKDYFTYNYSEEIVEHGIKCCDIIRLELKLK